MPAIKPPAWPLKLLRFFVKEEYLEEIEGDMEEVFYDLIEENSHQKASRIYTWEILKLLRPRLMKNFPSIHLYNQQAMFKNYFKVSTRNLFKNPLNSFINIIGLSFAIGICIFVYAFANWTYSTDQFHENKNEVFLTTIFANRDGSSQQFGLSPRPLGEMLQEDFPQVKNMCRVEDRNAVVKYGENVFNERIRFTDPDFLKMFTFPLKWGVANSLQDANSIILSEEMSQKYFGKENPIGQSILVKFNQTGKKAFTVAGVAAEFPESHTIDFDFLINFENLKAFEPQYDFQNWNAFVDATLIQVESASDIHAIAAQMTKYQKLQNEAVQPEWAISSFAFEPIATLHERSEYISDDISWSTHGDYMSVIYLSTVAIFMLALASFNYINIAIVSAAKRLKEIGVRKSIGATRQKVIIQFLSENLVITFLAMLIGMLVGWGIVIPWFEGLWNFNMGFQFNDPALWIFLPAILLITSFASGAYPSFYISKFEVVGILKGKVKFGRKNLLTKVLLGFQLVLACILLTSAVMFTQNTDYLAHRSWGYNQFGALYVNVPDQSAFEQLKAEMARETEVLDIAGSTNHLGKSKTSTVVHFSNRDYSADQFAVDPHYFETMGLELSAGRVFNDFEGSDKQAVVVNEMFVKNLGLNNPLGNQFQMDRLQYEIIGVVKDFHSDSFFEPVHPAIFTVANPKDFQYLSLKVKPGAQKETFKTLQAHWAGLYPETPFQGGFQEDVWGNYYKVIEIHSHVWRSVATIAILLVSLGLYGLLSLNVASRTREFSIRKVLGAGIKNITANLTRQYLALFLIALVIGAPVSFMLLKWLLSTAYAYHMPFNFSGVSIAVSILIFVLLFTILIQVKKVSSVNPVNGLKAE